ncbi:hypothetical protein E2C01_029174 [Portunus trituberculatus]|uniref:Uncharacterized protein n=1 Tax=Portunus trituberculatus TaxID=210409 RepID=A0A5B7EMC9_PORTR|nr:hypothetical protein [Portunus trituberculatus]
MVALCRTGSAQGCCEAPYPLPEDQSLTKLSETVSLLLDTVANLSSQVAAMAEEFKELWSRKEYCHTSPNTTVTFLSSLCMARFMLGE